MEEVPAVESRGSAAFWLSCWFSLNVALTLFNKMFFAWWSFPFPATLSLVHMLFSCVGSWILLSSTSSSPPPPPPSAPLSITTANTTAPISPTDDESWLESLRELFPLRVIFLSVVFTSNIAVGNASLRYSSVAFVQVVRGVIPGITMLLSILLLGKSYRLAHFLAVFLVIAGVILFMAGEMTVAATGFFVTLLGCVLSSLKVVLVNKLLSGKQKLSSWDLLFRMSALAVLQLFFVSSFLEIPRFSTTVPRDFYVPLVAALFVNGVCALLLNYTNFQTVRHTSALAVTIAGGLKQILTVAISSVLFLTPLSTVNLVGILLAVAGTFVYNGISRK